MSGPRIADPRPRPMRRQKPPVPTGGFVMSGPRRIAEAENRPGGGGRGAAVIAGRRGPRAAVIAGAAPARGQIAGGRGWGAVAIAGAPWPGRGRDRRGASPGYE